MKSKNHKSHGKTLVSKKPSLFQRPLMPGHELGPLNIDITELAPYIRSKRNIYNILAAEGNLQVKLIISIS